MFLSEEQKNLLDDDVIAQSVYYYYNMTLSYGSMFLGWPSNHELNPEKFRRKLEYLKELSLGNFSVKCAPFESVIDQHVDDFLSLHPPYYLEGDSNMFKGLYPNCNFAIHHKDFNHLALRDKLRQHRGGFLMTYNNCATIREWYKNYHFVYPSWSTPLDKGRPESERIERNNKPPIPRTATKSSLSE